MEYRGTEEKRFDDLTRDITAAKMIDLIQITPEIYQIKDPVQLEQAKCLCLARAEELGDRRKTIQRIISAVEKQAKDEAKEKMAYGQDLEIIPSYLECGKDGLPSETIQNFKNIMMHDAFYANVKYNVLTNQAERLRWNKGSLILDTWRDADDAESRAYIERTYRIYSQQKHSDALRILFREREYNPIVELVNSFEWDGKNRVETFLSRWMKADDTDYVREVSRLIFAGGINRLYQPGCKFDDVVVLIGTMQGEGKSTLIKWLALNDLWRGIVKGVEGQESVEAITGKWICEIPELSAFKKASDVEAIKAFVTMEMDRYRRPYDRYPADYPRRCIFIGTTNNEQFLVDMTGNRRFFPVYCHSNGYELMTQEAECRAEIEQCWAEARERYKAGEMPPFAKPELLTEYRRMQELAMEDDWRIGKIKAFLERYHKGEKVCAIQIYQECLHPDSANTPTKRESREIGEIMAKMTGWEKRQLARFTKYGCQRGWEKITDATPARISGSRLDLKTKSPSDSYY